MKFSLIRPACMLAMAAALASCGGSDDDNFTVGGTVNGLLYPGLVMTNAGADVSVAPPAKAGDPVTFSFPNKIEYGDTYLITVKNQPAHQTCEVSQGAPRSNEDTAGRLATINARFDCFINAYSIGGKITGLTKDNTGLELANGSTTGKVLIPPSTTDTTGAAFDYEMPVKVPYGQTYSLTVVTQPVGRFCTVANPAGTMGDAKVTNIDINCVPR